MKKISLLLLLAMVIGGAINAEATLFDRGNQMIYDDDLDVTWYDFTYQSSDWEDAMAWAADLTVVIGDGSYDDWRLPSAGPDPQWGPDQTDCEMGHLYYTELGNISFGGSLLSGPFTNLTSNPYWAGTPYSDYSSWVFGFATGRQLIYTNNWNLYTIAVHPGDVGGGAPVPEPATLLLLGTGLVGLSAFTRKGGKRH